MTKHREPFPKESPRCSNQQCLLPCPSTRLAPEGASGVTARAHTAELGGVGRVVPCGGGLGKAFVDISRCKLKALANDSFCWWFDGANNIRVLDLKV